MEGLPALCHSCGRGTDKHKLSDTETLSNLHPADGACLLNRHCWSVGCFLRPSCAAGSVIKKLGRVTCELTLEIGERFEPQRQRKESILVQQTICDSSNINNNNNNDTMNPWQNTRRIGDPESKPLNMLL